MLSSPPPPPPPSSAMCCCCWCGAVFHEVVSGTRPLPDVMCPACEGWHTVELEAGALVLSRLARDGAASEPEPCQDGVCARSIWSTEQAARIKLLVDPLREGLPVRITSGYRSPEVKP